MFFTKNEIEDVLDKVLTLFLIPRFRELGMNASGEWLENLEKAAGENSGIIRGREYTRQLVHGRKPGGLPPISQLEKWVTAKFGVTGPEATSIAWAVAKKIEKEGTSWYQKGGSNLLEVFEEPRTLQYIKDELGAIAKVKIAEQLIRNAQEAFR